ncbi:MAG: lipid A export permease/ATP-binding protein MsbA [Pseudomonadales bacterium]|nr:lipid A export permease/ATP-binding protein MsbA [Pseudomonadales bacterium]
MKSEYKIPLTAAKPGVLNGLGLYRRLLAYLKPLRLVFVISILGFVVFGGSNALFAELLRRLIDMIEIGNTITAAERLQIPIDLIGIMLIRGLGGFVGSYSMAYVANHVVHHLRSQIVGRFMQLPLPFYDRNASGHLISSVIYNVAQVSAAVSESLTVIFREGFTVIGLVLYLFYLNWKLSLVFLAATPVISLVVLLASKKFRKHSTRMQLSMGDVTHILSEAIKGLKVIRSFGAEAQITKKFEEASYRNLKQNLKMSATKELSTPLVQLVVSAALALLIWFAMAPEALAQITAGQFVAFITAAGMLLKPIRQLSNVNSEVQKGLAAAASIFRLIDEAPEIDKGSVEIPRVAGEVEFRQVAFAYGNGNEQSKILHNINFTCRAGETIAIVGKSGSGKSTLVNLIPRFYDLLAGEILIDGIPNTAYTLANLRSHIALVSQQVILFSGTIRDNIAYGALADASDEQVLEALSNANAMEFISQLPEGIHTKVGDDGTLLSGGQRQRLAIARALLKNAPILIFDEATSALDTVSEHYIQNALEKLMVDRSTFVIAHRLSTIQKAQQILVMNEGRIVEAGTHLELLQLGQYYARLHRMQVVNE